jgi:hypothetical protein
MRHAAAELWQLNIIYVAWTAGIIFKRLQDLWCGSQQGTRRVRCGSSCSDCLLMQDDHQRRDSKHSSSATPSSPSSHFRPCAKAQTEQHALALTCMLAAAAWLCGHSLTDPTPLTFQADHLLLSAHQ